MKAKYLIISLLGVLWACQQQTYTNNSTSNATASVPKVEKFIPDYPLNRFESEITTLEKFDAGTPQGQIVFYGSSSFRLWTSMQTDLENNQILNHGFGGSTFPELTYYVDRMVVAYHPKTVVIYCENDMFMTKPKTPDQTIADYKELIEKIRNVLPDVKIFTMSLKPSPSRKDKWADVEKVNLAIKNYSAKMKSMYYIDITNVMFESNGRLNSNLYKGDSLHMNQSGYKLWSDILKPILK